MFKNVFELYQIVILSKAGKFYQNVIETLFDNLQ